LANELTHVSAGAVLTRPEFEAVTAHAFNSQATGDIMYASSPTQLSRLGIGSTGQVPVVVGGLPVWGNAPRLNSPTINEAVALTVTATVLNYCTGVTSALQTQLDGKQPLDATLTSIALLGTAADKMLYATAIDTWAEAALTAAGRALLDDANAAAQLVTLGFTATITELNYVDGVTSAIQTQMNLKAPLISPSFTTPTLGVATATSINKITITQPATGATLTLVEGSSLITAGAYATTLTATAATNVTLPITGTLATLAGAETFTAKVSYNGLVITANTGAITTGSWTATVISPVYGGTGVANNVASTLTITGAYTLALTLSNTTAVTLPTTGTLATLAGTEELDNKTLDSSVAKGTWTASGVWTIPAVTLGGVVSGVSTTNYFDAGSNHMKVATTGVQAGFQIYVTNDGAYGVGFYGFHLSATPAAEDITFALAAYSKDTGGTTRGTHSIDFMVESVGAAVITSKYRWQTVINNIWNVAMTLSSAGALWTDASVDTLLYKVSGTQVVGARVVDARCDDVVDNTYGAEEAGVLDALRDAMISHGLIAAA